MNIMSWSGSNGCCCFSKRTIQQPHSISQMKLHFVYFRVARINTIYNAKQKRLHHTDCLILFSLLSCRSAQTNALIKNNKKCKLLFHESWSIWDWISLHDPNQCKKRQTIIFWRKWGTGVSEFKKKNIK